MFHPYERGTPHHHHPSVCAGARTRASRSLSVIFINLLFFIFLLWGVELNLKVRFTGPGSFRPVKEVPAGARRTL